LHDSLTRRAIFQPRIYLGGKTKHNSTTTSCLAQSVHLAPLPPLHIVTLESLTSDGLGSSQNTNTIAKPRANTIKEPPTSKIVTPQQQCRVPCPNANPNAAAPLSRTVPPRSNTCPLHALSNTQYTLRTLATNCTRVGVRPPRHARTHSQMIFMISDSRTRFAYSASTKKLGPRKTQNSASDL
ncbi:unnamed protein product, partial [Ectocarpus sp. 12 AP-2014]